MMKYWIIVDDRHSGPFSAEQLLDTGLMPDTLVWCEGLADWTRADLVPELAEGIRMRRMGCRPAASEVSYVAGPSGEHHERTCRAEHEQAYSPHDAGAGHSAAYAGAEQAAKPVAEPEPCPPAYIAWSVIVTLLCCTIVGIPAIIFASMTKSAYYRGDIVRAKRYSELAQWFIIASIVLGAVSWPFQIAFMNFF